MFNNEDANQNQNILIHQILSKTEPIKAIELFSDYKSNLTIENIAMIQEALFYKLIYKDPSKLSKMFYELERKGSLKERDIVKILDKKGGSRDTMKSWLKGFEKLGYLEKSRIKEYSPRPKYIYISNKSFEEISRMLPNAYCCMASNDFDSNFILEKKQIPADSVHKYIDCINERLSYIHFDKEKEESFEATKLIHTLLDSGATISDAVSILDEISNELSKITPYLKGMTQIIEKKYIFELIIKALERKKMYDILYYYKSEDILKQSGFYLTTDAVKIFEKQIKDSYWNKEYTEEEIFSIIFEKIYKNKIEYYQNKENIILKIEDFIKKSSEEKDYFLIEKYNYNKLMKEITLSMLIRIGYLSTFSNPLGSLKNILKKQKNDLKIEKLKSHEKIDEFLKSIKFSSRIMQRIDNKKDINSEDFKNINEYFNIIIYFYMEIF